MGGIIRSLTEARTADLRTESKCDEMSSDSAPSCLMLLACLHFRFILYLKNKLPFVFA